MTSNLQQSDKVLSSAFKEKSEGLNMKNFEYFREVLIDHLEEILSNSDKAVLNMTAATENILDLTSRVFFETDQDYMLSVGERRTKIIKKIRESLDRIENDTYTTCKTCAEEIPLARLIVRPVSTKCIDCKTKEEATERARLSGAEGMKCVVTFQSS